MLKHEEQEQLIDSIIDRFDNDIAIVLLEVEKALNDILLTYGINETTALEFQNIFINMLVQVGYYDKVNDLIDNKFDEIYSLIRQGFNESGLNVRYTNEDLIKIKALKELQLNQFNNLANDTATKIQQGLYKYTLSNASLYQIQKQLQEDFKNTNLAKYSTTLARTAIGDFQQSVIDLKAQDLNCVWIYVGVNDKLTRPFCKSVLHDHKYYNDSQKLEIQNNPLRKYNCRHRLRAVSLDYAKENGYHGI